MKKNLLESEIKRFQELSNYDANNNSVLSVYSEKELFDKINMEYIKPVNRNV